MKRLAEAEETLARYQPRGPFCGPTQVVRECKAARAAGLSSRAYSVQVRSRMPFCPRSSDRSERHPAKMEVAGAIPAVDTILPLCLSKTLGASPTRDARLARRLRAGRPFHGGHGVIAA